MTGATPNGRPLEEQGETFARLVYLAHRARFEQQRMNTTVFGETCKVMGGLGGLGGKR